MVAFVLLCLPIAFWVGHEGWISLLAAATICLVSGLAALGFSHHFSSIGHSLPGMLLAMGCRLAPPLLVCLWLALHQDQSNHNSFVGFLIVAYLVSLAAETFLSIRMIDSLPTKPVTN